MVTELLDGETLGDRLSTGRLPLRKTIDFAMHIAQGLAAAHGKGITHGDIKPENLFVTTHGHVKILDFGLATELRWVLSKCLAKDPDERYQSTCDLVVDLKSVMRALDSS